MTTPVDPYESYGKTLESYGRTSRAVTPGAADIDPVPKAVVCLTTGNITVVPLGNSDDATVAFVGVPAGFMPPFRVRQVTAATATVATVED
jgi:hypothetical protein